MFKYQILVEYEGTNFRGWQVQKKGKTIQGLIQEKISNLLKEKIVLIGSGRTDTGVHAIEQSAHFECKNEIKQFDRFLKSMNHFLNNNGVAILKIRKRNKYFHARFSAKLRIYKYIIINRLSRPVLNRNRGWHVMKKLDPFIMKKGAKKLIGTKDFSTFRASSCRAKSPIKTMKLIKIRSYQNKIEIEFRSQSFLQQQVRSMVGCLKYLGENKWSLKKFQNVIKSKKRILCAPPAPPEGLFLVRIIY
ncbi:tRNA pseudouridine(38-40) synthase TruA [Candidatus Pelagibacter communis]|uniref:tRNA pseudouridine(38-40) synthase TruA n=1 Tax=Pelagibacter ubique TaxID=198252 RepID=UPI00094C45F2|nr:tRNA pseudouridine(38-40) synthase TruA [Candidatus Pelagibacter ubique]|tara:strand:- start:243 stop:983 length:741 start_codon:yes stop_codon:yes gene_type:complete